MKLRRENILYWSVASLGMLLLVLYALSVSHRDQKIVSLGDLPEMVQETEGYLISSTLPVDLESVYAWQAKIVYAKEQVNRRGYDILLLVVPVDYGYYNESWPSLAEKESFPEKQDQLYDWLQSLSGVDQYVLACRSESHDHLSLGTVIHSWQRFLINYVGDHENSQFDRACDWAQTNNLNQRDAIYRYMTHNGPAKGFVGVGNCGGLDRIYQRLIEGNLRAEHPVLWENLVSFLSRVRVAKLLTRISDLEANQGLLPIYSWEKEEVQAALDLFGVAYTVHDEA